MTLQRLTGECARQSRSECERSCALRRGNGGMYLQSIISIAHVINHQFSVNVIGEVQVFSPQFWTVSNVVLDWTST